MVAGAALSLFSCIAVNYWIYAARIWFIDTQSEVWTEPPTISRAISIEMIGDPFSIWIAVSAVCLAIAVGLLAHHYLGLYRITLAPKLGLRIALLLLIPLAFLLQLASGWGMTTLSFHSLPRSHDMHMLGSYTFFASQALVILLYALVNHALLKDPDNLVRAAMARRVTPSWVKWRRIVAWFSVAMTAVYGALFMLKSAYPYEDTPWIFLAYVTTEPLVITCFLVVVVMAFADKLRRPVDL